ncbi:MAG: polysaccharide deacetylase family protein [Candidatus Omnitrophota bacterium]
MRKIFLVLSLVIIFLVTFYFFGLSPKYTVPILMYHNIGHEAGSFYVSPENFAKQMEYIKKHGYEVITLDELVESTKDKKPLKRNKVVITFDDGYKDNFEYAYPILKKYGFPATIFIITDFAGKSFENGKEFLSWDQIILMSRDRISLGSHTKTHLNLGQPIDEKAALEEITGSKRAIEQQINMPVNYFCYPSGAFCQASKKMVMDAGYKGAVTTNRGEDRFNRNIFELKRIKVTNSDTVKPLSFQVKLSGYYNILRQEKKPY